MTSSPSPAWRHPGFTATLGPIFHSAVAAQPMPQPHWVAHSAALAAELGLTAWLAGDEALAVLSGNRPATPEPAAQALATVYSGHQFGVWAGQLGDGRALLLGEIDSPLGALEVQLKGAGPTPYSRRGDGRAVLRSSVREFLCSEAMHALGVPTTRALAIVGSPLPVRRETVETAAVVTRVAPSFLRFGHFEHFAHTADDTQALRTLADAAIARYFPALMAQPLPAVSTLPAASGESAASLPPGDAAPYLALLQEVALRTARLMAQWQALGFCHGVMNTDNMSLLGLTIDYGPFGFLDAFDPGHICNHSDHAGRYAWARQPNVAFWNLHALAQALMPLIGDSDAALAALAPYKTAYAQAMLGHWRAKLGLRDGVAAAADDQTLVDDLLQQMAAAGTDFSICFRRLSSFGNRPRVDHGGESGNGVSSATGLRDLFLDREAFDAWGSRYRTRLQAEGSVDAERAVRMNAVNPKYILRNHLAEAAIRRAREGDFTEVQRLHRVLQRPFDEQPEHEADAGFPPAWAQQLEISCSS